MKKFLWRLFFFASIIVSTSVCRTIIENTKGALYNAMMRGASVQEMEKIVQQNNSLINARDIQRRTPLHWAALYALPETVEFLLRAGANPNAKDFQGDTPLHLLVRFDVDPFTRKHIMLDLLNYGADIYKRNEDGFSVVDSANPFNYRKYLLRESIRQRKSNRERTH